MNSNLPVLKGRYSSLGVKSDIQVGILSSKSKPKISINNFEENNNNNNSNNDNIFSTKISPEKAELKAKTIKITQMSHNIDMQNVSENTMKSLKIMTSPIRKLPSRNNSGNDCSYSKTKASLKHGTYARSLSHSYDLNGTRPNLNPDDQGARIAQAIVPSKRLMPTLLSSRIDSSSHSNNNSNGNTSKSNTNAATVSYARSARRVRTSHGYSSSSLYDNSNINYNMNGNRPPPSPSKPSQSEIELWKAAAQDRLAKSTEKLKQQKLRDKNLSESSSSRRGENYLDKINATQRKRAEIYAINALLKKAEQEKYKAYCSSHAPLDTDEDDNGSDSDDSGSNDYDDSDKTSTPVASPMRNPSSSPAPSPFRMNVNVHL